MSMFFSHPKLCELRAQCSAPAGSWTIYANGPTQGFIACHEEPIGDGVRQVVRSVELPTRHEVERFLVMLTASGWSRESSKS